MRKVFWLIVLFFLFVSCEQNNDHELGNVSLIFLNRDINDSYTINDIKYELFANELIDSVRTEGEEFPVIVINMKSDYLMKFDLTVDDVRQAIKNEVDIPEVVTSENSIILFKESEFKNLYKYKDSNELMLIPIKKLKENLIVRLKHVAKIHIDFHREDIYYQKDKVNIISFYFNGKSKEELTLALKPVEKHRLKYKLVYGKME